jgi:AAA domain
MPDLQASIKAIVTEPYFKKKWRRKMIDRPDYVTDEEWQEACRAAKKPKPAEGARKRNGASARDGFDSAWAGPDSQPANWTVALTCASSIKPAPISWLWWEWLAGGKMHIIAGQPGSGKTTIAMKIAATVSAGSRWPDGSTSKQGNVIIWSGEDDYADTLVPRLEASGADLSRIFFAGEMTCGKERRAFDPAKDIPALEAAIERGEAQV